MTTVTPCKSATCPTLVPAGSSRFSLCKYSVLYKHSLGRKKLDDLLVNLQKIVLKERKKIKRSPFLA